MKDRYNTQLTGAFATASVWSLPAERFGIDMWTTVLVLFGLLLLLPLVNRASGWTREPG